MPTLKRPSSNSQSLSPIAAAPLFFEQQFPPSFVDMKQVAALILSGGEGTRLHPLTLTRSKPAINFGGQYRLIDVPISHALHADCRKIYILTQFLSSSLHHHIFQTYLHLKRGSEAIEILTAEQKPLQKSWYQGTADAVRQNLEYLLETDVEYFLILSGDQLYNIDFRKMVHFALSTGAEVVVAAIPVKRQEAKRMGVLKVDPSHRITAFYEKPQESEILDRFAVSQKALEALGDSFQGCEFLASMGIYLFKKSALIEALQRDEREDFGKHLIPTLVEKNKVAAFVYNGYWEDIGTIKTFYEANMALLESKPKFNFYHEQRPIYARQENLPPVNIFNAQVKNCMICAGSIIEAQEVKNSILGPRTILEKGAIVKDSYLMGNDYYESPLASIGKEPRHPRIGENSIVSKAIIDKNVCIGKAVQLVNRENLSHYTSDLLHVREGILIVPRGVTIPDHFIF